MYVVVMAVPDRTLSARHDKRNPPKSALMCTMTEAEHALNQDTNHEGNIFHILMLIKNTNDSCAIITTAHLQSARH